MYFLSAAKFIIGNQHKERSPINQLKEQRHSPM